MCIAPRVALQTCGVTMDPGQPADPFVTAGGLKAPSQSALLGRVGWVMFALAFAWLLFALWLFSNVDPGFSVLTAFDWGFPLGVVWTVFSIVVALVLIRRSLPLRPGMLGGVVMLPLSVSLWYAAVSFDLPFRARFYLSDGSLESFASSFPEGGSEQYDPSKRVGLFYISRADEVDGCVRLATRGGYFGGGLAYCDHPPRDILGDGQRDTYDHFAGRWWKWYSYID